MSKCISVIPLSNIERIAILPGGGRSLSQVKGNADYIINGGFYDMDTGKPVGHLKIAGEVKSREAWNCFGFRCDTGADIRMDVVPDSGGQNYISGVELLTPGLGEGGKLSYRADVGGTRGRSAIGIAGDKLVLYCSGDGTKDGKTPEKLRDELVSIGCTRAIMLDSGGSSQCDFKGETISSSRRVHNYLAIWLKKDASEDPTKGSADTMSKKTVVLDPGHGVETAGKRSPDGSYLEHEFNLDMANRIKVILERHGVEVVLTRSTKNDVTLANRVKIANGISGLALFVSIHSNASGDGKGWTDPDGYGIYTSAKGDTAERNKAAKAILAEAKAAGIQMWGGGLFHDISLYVLKNTTAPAVLIEHGFHTNIHEVELLKHTVYRDLLAKVDAKGILKYLGIPYVEKPADGKNDGKDAPSAWAASSWKKATTKGVFDGTNPQGALTREQAAVILDRLGLLK